MSCCFQTFNSLCPSLSRSSRSPSLPLLLCLSLSFVLFVFSSLFRFLSFFFVTLSFCIYCSLHGLLRSVASSQAFSSASLISCAALFVAWRNAAVNKIISNSFLSEILLCSFRINSKSKDSKKISKSVCIFCCFHESVRFGQLMNCKPAVNRQPCLTKMKMTSMCSNPVTRNTLLQACLSIRRRKQRSSIIWNGCVNLSWAGMLWFKRLSKSSGSSKKTFHYTIWNGLQTILSDETHRIIWFQAVSEIFCWAKNRAVCDWTLAASSQPIWLGESSKLFSAWKETFQQVDFFYFSFFVKKNYKQSISLFVLFLKLWMREDES